MCTVWWWRFCHRLCSVWRKKKVKWSRISFCVVGTTVMGCSSRTLRVFLSTAACATLLTSTHFCLQRWRSYSSSSYLAQVMCFLTALTYDIIYPSKSMVTAHRPNEKKASDCFMSSIYIHRLVSAAVSGSHEANPESLLGLFAAYLSLLPRTPPWRGCKSTYKHWFLLLVFACVLCLFYAQASQCPSVGGNNTIFTSNGGWLTQANISVASFSCGWRIDAPVGNVIVLTFASLCISQSDAELVLFEGSSALCNRLVTLAGPACGDDALPSPALYRSSSNAIFFLFPDPSTASHLLFSLSWSFEGALLCFFVSLFPCFPLFAAASCLLVTRLYGSVKTIRSMFSVQKKRRLRESVWLLAAFVGVR